MDHLLRRVGFIPTLTHIQSELHCKEVLIEDFPQFLGSLPRTKRSIERHYIILSVTFFSGYFLIHPVIKPFLDQTKKQMVVPSGFEPESPAPKASMIDHYTTGL